MKYTLIMLLIPINLVAQESNSWKDNFNHYQGSYKDDFSCNRLYTQKEKKQVNNFPFGHYCGYINVSLRSNGNYHIYLESTKLAGDSLILEEFTFEGKYSVDSLGKLTLNGHHPFEHNKMEIKEDYNRKKGIKYITNRSLNYRFNDQFKWITNKERNTYCDGCKLTPNE